jgi:hypothetical protein
VLRLQLGGLVLHVLVRIRLLRDVDLLVRLRDVEFALVLAKL